MTCVHDDGRVRPDVEMVEDMELECRLVGFVAMVANYQPEIGEIQVFAGIPMKVIRYIDQAEYEKISLILNRYFDERGPWNPDEFAFACVPAD